MKLKTALRVLGVLAVLFTLLPFVAMDYWWIRIFDFPHTQLTIFTLVALVLYFVRFDIRSPRDYLFIIILGLCFVFQLGKIYPYTPFAPYEAENSQNTDPNNAISILASNVLQDNERTDLLLAEILRRRPNLIILTETNERWRQAVSPALQQRYPYRVEVPLDNTYGMLLYSDYELEHPEVRYLVEDSIPSIHTVLVLPSQQKINLYAIHPTPPVPQHNPSSTDRDAEMMIIAKMVQESSLPVIVTGDFNDVAWSQTTRLFQNVSGLLDPRKGRGFFNTFNAQSWLMRWPLDHLFFSEEFRVLELATGNDIESDHFPLYGHLTFEPTLAAEQRMEEPTAKELKEADDQIKEKYEDNEIDQ